MSSSTTPSALYSRTEDVLAHLPISSTREYSKGEMIYGPGTRLNHIYLVVGGKVALSQMLEDGTEVLLEIARPDELFGESAFLDIPRGAERARAIEKVTLMMWAISDVEDLVMKRPRLAVALLQVLAQRNIEFTRRIESFATEGTERRLALSLLHFSERLGSREADGSVRMMPFTHEMLARYVGTTREVITQYMNRFRNQGYVNYSRKGILLYRDALSHWLNKRTLAVSEPTN